MEPLGLPCKVSNADLKMNGNACSSSMGQEDKISPSGRPTSTCQAKAYEQQYIHVYMHAAQELVALLWMDKISAQFTHVG